MNGDDVNGDGERNAVVFMMMVEIGLFIVLRGAYALFLCVKECPEK